MQCRKHGLTDILQEIYSQYADFRPQAFTNRQKCGIIILKVESAIFISYVRFDQDNILNSK